MLSLPQYGSGDEELMVLPLLTKVIVTGKTGESWLWSACRVSSRRLFGLGGRHMLVSLALIIEASHWYFALVAGTLS
jgi:hypothetical protein